MSGQAGYDLGKEMGKLMDRKYTKKLSQILAKLGNIMGIGLLVIGVFICLFADDSEVMGVALLIGFGGVCFFGLMHLIAWKHDQPKKH